MAGEIGEVTGYEPSFIVQAQAAGSDLIANIETQKAVLGLPKVRFADGIQDVL